MSIFSRNSTQNNQDASVDEDAQEADLDSSVAQEIELAEVAVNSQDEITRLEKVPRQSTVYKPSIISEGFTFEGTITSEGTLNISGVVRGKVTAKSILIDTSGKVDGELNAENLVIKGQLNGDVSCDDLNVGPLARVDGSISYKYIHIQRGGRVAGKFIKN